MHRRKTALRFFFSFYSRQKPVQARTVYLNGRTILRAFRNNEKRTVKSFL